MAEQAAAIAASCQDVSHVERWRGRVLPSRGTGGASGRREKEGEAERKEEIRKDSEEILSEVLIGFLVLITQPGSYSDKAADCSLRVSFVLVRDVISNLPVLFCY